MFFIFTAMGLVSLSLPPGSSPVRVRMKMNLRNDSVYSALDTFFLNDLLVFKDTRAIGAYRCVCFNATVVLNRATDGGFLYAENHLFGNKIPKDWIQNLALQAKGSYQIHFNSITVVSSNNRDTFVSPKGIYYKVNPKE